MRNPIVASVETVPVLFYRGLAKTSNQIQGTELSFQASLKG